MKKRQGNAGGFSLRSAVSGRGILVAAVVVILVAAAVGALWVNDTRRRGEEEIKGFKDAAMERHRNELHNLVDVAYGTVEIAHRRLAEQGVAPGSPAEAAVQQQVLEALRHLRYQEGDYFWVNNLEPRMLMHPYQSSLEGQDLSDYQDPYGVFLFREFTRVCAEQSAGFVTYAWPRPGQVEPQPKLSYVRLFRPWGWILGTGMYVDDIDREIAARRAQIDRMVRAQTLQILSFILAGCFFVATVAVVLQRRRQVNLAVAASEQRLRLLLEAGPDGVVVFDTADGRIRVANPALGWILGREPKELVGQRVPRRVREAVKNVVAEGWPQGVPFDLGSEVLRRPNGSEVFLEDTGTFLEFEGRPSVVAFVRDATARRQAEERVRRHEELLTTVLNNTDNSLMVLDAERRVVYYNDRYVQRMGMTREFLDSAPRVEDILRWACQTGLYPANQVDSLIARRLEDLASAEPRRRIETPRQDGVVMEGYTTRLPGGGHLLAFRDVTERVRAAEALRAEKDFSESLVQSSGVATFVLSPEHQVLAWNRACEELTGLAAAQVLGTLDHWKAFYPARRPCLADLVLDRSAEEGDTYYTVFGPSPLNPEGLHAEGWYPNLGGKDRYLVFDAVPIRASDGRLLAAVETLQDLTNLKQAEEAQELLTTAVEQSDEAIVVTDTRGVIEYVNRAFASITGYSSEEALGQNASLLNSGRHEPEFYRGLWETIQRGEVWKGRLVNRRKDGREYQEENTISPVRNSAGEIRHFVAVKRDVTHELELERRLAESQRLESLGTLAGGIAHDFNNVLAAIYGFAELTLDDVPPETPAAKNLESILAGTTRAKELVQQILTFSRRVADQDEEPEALPVGPVVEDILRFLRASVPSAVEVRGEITPGAYAVVLRPSHLRQVLLNLCTNAAQAMQQQGGGVLEVRAAPESLPTGRYVHLVVRDTGPGVPAEVLGRIFEPYFTTKPVGEGSGMGLAVVHGIVQGLGGRIEVESQPGAGARFDLWLPRAPADPESDPLPSRRPRILVVDDDAEVLAVQTLLLRSLDGYDVVGEADAAGALARLQEVQEPYSLLITDQGLPGMTGIELVRRAQTLRPGLPVILSSGDSGAIPAEVPGVHLAARLDKPWSRAQLVETLQQVLGHDALSTR